MPRVFRALTPPPKGSSPKVPAVTKPPAQLPASKKRVSTSKKDVDSNDDEEFIPPSKYLYLLLI